MFGRTLSDHEAALLLLLLYIRNPEKILWTCKTRIHSSFKSWADVRPRLPHTTTEHRWTAVRGGRADGSAKGGRVDGAVRGGRVED